MLEAAKNGRADLMSGLPETEKLFQVQLIKVSSGTRK